LSPALGIVYHHTLPGGGRGVSTLLCHRHKMQYKVTNLNMLKLHNQRGMWHLRNAESPVAVGTVCHRFHSFE
jgi:hypothetical protein